jgi:hypothetical protein
MTDERKLDETAELEKLVNRSGFPFQLRVEHEIRKTSAQHRWSVTSREHPWSDTGKSPKEHFLDLVLSKDSMRMAVECKRVQNASWIFLIDPTTLAGESGSPEICARAFWASRLPDNKQLYTWWDFDVRPSTVESEFCVVHGAADDQSPMLERLGRHLVSAAEEVGRLALDLGEAGGAVIVFPVIVTTATLYACATDPANISDDGMITGATFAEIPYIRFRKSLASSLTGAAKKPRTVAQADENRERTMFVVNSKHLVSMLTKWQLTDLGGWGWPHQTFGGAGLPAGAI